MNIHKSEKDIGVRDGEPGYDAETPNASDQSDNRQEDRVDFRTTGLAYILGDEGLEPIGAPIRIWTVDVSTMGCLIRSYDPIRSQRLLVKLFLPQLRETLIEAHIVRDLQDKAKFLNGKEQESHLYGVKFTKMMKQNEIDIELPPPISENSLQEEILSQEESQEATEIQEMQHLTDTRMITVGLLAVASVVTIWVTMLA